MTFQRNTFKRGVAAASIIAAMTAWGAAEAATTTYSASATGTLALNLSQPEDLGLANADDLVISWEISEAVQKDFFGNNVTGNNSAAFGNAQSSGSAYNTLTGPVVSFSVSASANGNADATVLGTKTDSFADSLAALAITVTNNGTTGYTIFGDLSYNTETTDNATAAAGEFAYAESDAFLLLEAIGAGNLLATSGETIDFFVAAGSTETIVFEAYANGLSEAFAAPVPVPAALPLLASALLGGGIFARRSRV